MLKSFSEMLLLRAADDSCALMTEYGDKISFRELFEISSRLSNSLARHGLGPKSRVALAMRGGTDMVLTLAGCLGQVVTSPLNPSYLRTEFEFSFRDLGVQAVILDGYQSHEARDAARSAGVPVIEVFRGNESEPRSVVLADPLTPARYPQPSPSPSDTALLLHTSGTTGRAKKVPLSHAAIMLTARNIASALRLRASDLSLNVMPMFHVHGLLNVLLSSWTAGAAVACLPEFDPENFCKALADLRPTWYSAVPTIHQTILFHYRRAMDGAPVQSLRLVRSSSAPLPPAVADELERVFGCPVIESYGMSEVDQIATNPLPPLARKRGSVGLPGGPEVDVVDFEGRTLANGVIGEVVVRGDNVLAAYEASYEVNAQSFRDGWFRTGDLGYRDRDGYLFLVGRIKEIINRAGEKIAPREIDDVLLEHPAVAQAAAYGVPHPNLGEDVHAAVVLRSGMSASPLSLRKFVSERLANFKVPRVVRLVDALPKGPTGKLRRVELAETAPASASSVDLTSDATGTKDSVSANLRCALSSIWRDVLQLESLDDDDDFLAMGGTSVLAKRLFARIESRFNRRLPIEAVLMASTVRQQAAALVANGWQAPH